MATTLIGAHAFEHLYAHSIPVIILAIITEFELGALSVGAVVAIRSIFGGVTSVTGGFLVDLFHHRVAWVLSVSTFMIGLGYLLMSIAPSYALILCALALGSMGSALWHPPALGLLARRFPERRGLFISMHRSTGSIGDVIGAPGRRRPAGRRPHLERRRRRGAGRAVPGPCPGVPLTGAISWASAPRLCSLPPC